MQIQFNLTQIPQAHATRIFPMAQGYIQDDVMSVLHLGVHHSLSAINLGVSCLDALSAANFQVEHTDPSETGPTKARAVAHETQANSKTQVLLARLCFIYCIQVPLGPIFVLQVIPQVIEILHIFQHTHPIIDHFDKYFTNKPVQARRQKLAAFGLVSTPELNALLQPVLEVLERIIGVGSALLQLLAVQDQLKEPLNLNDGRVVHCPVTAIVVLIPCSHPSLYRGGQSILVYGTKHCQSSKTVAAARHTKRKANKQVEGEKVRKRAKKVQIAEEKKRPTPTPRRLRSGKVR
ncbi:hypothetical protein B0H17DRAFT_1148130 [Mycena rosella]|uniref:Uncharacterized protein n=1 Tax=Mycena rosella TaxID=1033263 RepID=A0AAD7CDH4_MYCRO|nr:hypothetical protein B0H17DRAFT_1148130 [Mycena rosella]